jgi:hypothetical protein
MAARISFAIYQEKADEADHYEEGTLLQMGYRRSMLDLRDAAASSQNQPKHSITAHPTSLCSFAIGWLVS